MLYYKVAALMNKWSKYFDQRPHCSGIFHWENVMWH